jgi:hypothetical protein
MPPSRHRRISENINTTNVDYWYKFKSSTGDTYTVKQDIYFSLDDGANRGDVLYKNNILVGLITMPPKKKKLTDNTDEVMFIIQNIVETDSIKREVITSDYGYVNRFFNTLQKPKWVVQIVNGTSHRSFFIKHVTIERPSGARSWLRGTHSPAETIVRELAGIRGTYISKDEISQTEKNDKKNENVVFATAPRQNTGFIPGVVTDTNPSEHTGFIPIRYNHVGQIPKATPVASKVANSKNTNKTNKPPMGILVNGGGTPKSLKKKPKKSLKKKPKKSLKKKPKKLSKKKPKKLSKKKSTKKSTSKSTPKKHKGPRGGVYIIRKGRKIYQ